MACHFSAKYPDVHAGVTTVTRFVCIHAGIVSNQPEKERIAMPEFNFHYPLGGLLVLIGSIGLLKGLDFLAAQSVKRLLEMAARPQGESGRT
ncbi:hypothetical protein [Desulfosarcina ovata]|nr:hypothetical protein [Desulfosarcina ovata]